MQSLSPISHISSILSQSKPQTHKLSFPKHGVLPSLRFNLSHTHFKNENCKNTFLLVHCNFHTNANVTSLKKFCWEGLVGELWRETAKKFVLLVFGTFLLVGRFGLTPRPCLAALESTIMKEKSGFGDEEEKLCLKLLEKNPRDVKALKMVLYGKMKRGKTKESIEYVEKLIEIEPGDVEWRLLQALSYEMIGYLSKAKRLFKEILEERPLLVRALHGLALVMHKNHEGPAAFEMLNNALEVACREKMVTEERDIRILIAQMHVVKGELEEGLEKFQDLVNADPRDFRPYLCQGIIYSLLDKKKEAQEQFETYESLVPQEFAQRGFLDDVVLAAKTESR